MEDKIKRQENIKYAVIIPALNPSADLVDFVSRLLGHGIPQVIIVNDGSDSTFDGIFREAEKLESCTVLTHEVNRGKGRALKTAFSYFIENCPYLGGVVTADADGQHAVEDILRVGEMLSAKHGSLILGVRNFNDKNVPRRSYIGNQTTSRLFQLMYGYYLNDTQTGLRGIPSGELPWMVKMKGERYDFEINMLIKARQRHIDFYTMPIKTLYYNNNSGSHYSTVKDSARVFICLVSGLFNHPDSKSNAGYPGVLKLNILESAWSRIRTGMFKFARFCVRCFTPHYDVKRMDRTPAPAVYLVHHQSSHGPLITMAWFDMPVRLWVLSVFCTFRNSFRQYYGYTFTKRFHLPKIIAAIAALPMSLLMPWLTYSMRAIPVYRGSREIIETFKQGISALVEGRNLLICPDINYADRGINVGEMYTGFLDLEKQYVKQTGSHLAFVPLHVSDIEHRIYVGQTVYFGTGDSFKQEKEKAYFRIKEEFSRLERHSERSSTANVQDKNYTN